VLSLTASNVPASVTGVYGTRAAQEGPAATFALPLTLLFNVALAAEGSTFHVDIRNRPVAARVVKTPFYKK
jgi:glycine cleavage system aminomethyltransferase T